MVDRNIISNAETNKPNGFNTAQELGLRNSFSRREVGLTHPDTSAFVRLNDRGDIEIFAGEELGIVISPSSRAISIFADVVKIVTKEDYGLRWNNMSFNYASDMYNEPSLVSTSQKEYNSGFNYAHYYLDSVDDFTELEKSDNITTISGDFAYAKVPSEAREESPLVNKPSVIGENDRELLKEYALTNRQEKVDYMIKLLESGFTFSQAREKTLRDKGV